MCSSEQAIFLFPRIILFLEEVKDGKNIMKSFETRGYLVPEVRGMFKFLLLKFYDLTELSNLLY